MNRACAVLTDPWDWMCAPGVRVSAFTVPESDAGSAGDGDDDDSSTADIASGFKPLNTPAV